MGNPLCYVGGKRYTVFPSSGSLVPVERGPELLVLEHVGVALLHKLQSDDGLGCVEFGWSGWLSDAGWSFWSREHLGWGVIGVRCTITVMDGFVSVLMRRREVVDKYRLELCDPDFTSGCVV